MAIHNDIGEKGEKLAAEYLTRNGYKIIHCNWRYKHKEIDILAREKNTLVVVEVKLRSTDYFGDPSEAVTRKKQRFLIEAVEAYLDKIPDDPDVRFDVVSIVYSQNKYQIDHISDAFTPDP